MHGLFVFTFQSLKIRTIIFLRSKGGEAFGVIRAWQ